MKIIFDNYTKRDLKQEITNLTTAESGLEIPLNNGALCYCCFSSGVFSCHRLLAVNHYTSSLTLEQYASMHLDMRTISKTILALCIVEYMATDFSEHSTFEEAQIDALVQILTCGSNGWRTMDKILDLDHISGKFNNKTKQFMFSYFGPTISHRG